MKPLLTKRLAFCPNGEMRFDEVSAPTVIGSFKRYVSKQAGVSIWQKGFYDHIVRDDYDYQIRWQYIDENPAKWVDDEYF